MNVGVAAHGRVWHVVDFWHVDGGTVRFGVGLCGMTLLSSAPSWATERGDMRGCPRCELIEQRRLG